MTDTMERVGTTPDVLAGDTPPDEFRHYFKKDDLDRNLLDGAPITAVCGFVKGGLAHPDTSLPVCPRCAWLYENVMQPSDDERGD